jgi:hypothetical protein
MEPIEEWMTAKKIRVGAAELIFEDPTWAQGDGYFHPETHEVPMMKGDELTAVPSYKMPCDFPRCQCSMGSAERCNRPKGTVEEQQALHAFLNMASMAERTPERDMVTLPKHYARFPIEPIRFICENNLNFFQANIVKYILRWDAKNGLEDLRKAKRYLEMFIKFVQKDPDWWKAA